MNVKKIDNSNKESFFMNWKIVKINTIFFPILISSILFIIGQIVHPGFASLQNIGNILAIAGILAMIGAGQTIVIISGNFNIDLSLGALMSMGALLGCSLMQGLDQNIFLGFIGLIGIGAFFGFISGVNIHYLGIPALVMTLTMSEVIDGATIAITKGRPYYIVPPILLKIGGEKIFGWLRLFTIVTIIIMIIMTIILTRTRYGKMLFLMGDNRISARANGIKIPNLEITVFVLAGVIAAISGIFLLSIVGSAQMRMGADYTMLSIAAVVLGGTQLSGGKGSYIGTVMGAIVFTTLSSLLISIGMTEGVRLIITGFALIIILGLYSRQPTLRQ